MNKHMIIGHLGGDPELRFLPNGDKVTKFSVATTERWRNKDGEKKESTTWHNVVMYRKLAEVAAKYLKTGAKVYIEGRSITRKFDDKDGGKDRYITEIIADNLEMLDRNPNKGEPEASDNPEHQDHPFEDAVPA